MYIVKKKYIFIILIGALPTILLSSFEKYSSKLLFFRSAYKVCYKENPDEDGQDYHFNFDAQNFESADNLYQEHDENYDDEFYVNSDGTYAEVLQVCIAMYQEIIQVTVMHYITVDQNYHQDLDVIIYEIIFRYSKKIIQICIRNYIHYIQDDSIRLRDKIMHSLIFFSGMVGIVFAAREILSRQKIKNE